MKTKDRDSNQNVITKFKNRNRVGKDEKHNFLPEENKKLLSSLKCFDDVKVSQFPGFSNYPTKLIFGKSLTSLSGGNIFRVQIFKNG